jgi:hypothetical protein
MAKSNKYPKKKDNVSGANPCAEANLEHGEPCDLAELYMHNISSVEEAIDCALLLCKTQKAVLTLPSISPWTNEVVKRNMRIGLGVTGICENLEKITWLDEIYNSLRAFDKVWSKTRGWAESIKMTVVKPSGTLSLLAGCTPGGHPAYDRYFIRRVRMASNDSLVPICRNLGCHIEYVRKFDNTEDYGTVVVEFPCESSPTAVLAKDCSAVDQLEIMKSLQSVWADQSVSVTVYYRKEELPAIKEWLSENYDNGVKSVSFLLHVDHNFPLPPYEEISEDEYNKSVAKLDFSTPIHQNATDLTIDMDDCATGACPIK